jgi:hypothetical protein
MAQHVLPTGVQFIGWLTELGRALGYHTATEWPIDDPVGRTYVDVAWLRHEGSRDALFLFEVESRPGSGVAENAAKVLSVPTLHLPKPLFFFHVMLTGGGGRPGRAARSHDNANYGVYTLANASAADDLLRDILSQCARLKDGVDAFALWWALRDDRAPEISVASAIVAGRELLPATAWLTGLARAAIDDVDSRPILADLFAEAVLDGRTGTDEFPTYASACFGPALQLGVVANLRPMRGPECLDAIRRWQRGSPQDGWMTMVGPHWRLARDYDAFVLGFAPCVWAVLAVLLRNVEGGPAWVGDQLQMVLDDERLGGAAITPTAAWSLHLARAFGLSPLRAAVERAVDRVGGLRLADQRTPPIGVPEPEDRAGWTELSTRHTEEAVALAPVADNAAPDETGVRMEFDAVGAALSLLLFDDALWSALPVHVLAMLRRLAAPG